MLLYFILLNCFLIYQTDKVWFGRTTDFQGVLLSSSVKGSSRFDEQIQEMGFLLTLQKNQLRICVYLYVEGGVIIHWVFEKI